jgi:hypothetical protein
VTYTVSGRGCRSATSSATRQGAATTIGSGCVDTTPAITARIPTMPSRHASRLTRQIGCASTPPSGDGRLIRAGSVPGRAPAEGAGIVIGK